jgi:hypothetical protein
MLFVADTHTLLQATCTDIVVSVYFTFQRQQ